jgi:hypothetical protein
LSKIDDIVKKFLEALRKSVFSKNYLNIYYHSRNLGELSEIGVLQKNLLRFSIVLIGGFKVGASRLACQLASRLARFF